MSSLHFSLLCIGEGNGNPLQCSCLENPRDGGAWWAAVYGVAQSRTRQKQLRSSSSSSSFPYTCVCVCVYLWMLRNAVAGFCGKYVWLFTTKAFSRVAVSFYTSSINVQVIRFLCILNSIWYCRLFIFDRCSNRYLAMLIMAFLCVFLMTNDEHLLMCLVAIQICSLMKCVHLFCPFSKWIVFFLSVYLITLRALSIF